jgi:hypothetical protein
MTAGCRSELLTRVRRGVATAPDRLALDAHLGACASCRISWVLALDFDAAGAAEPGDAELLARIANAAIGGAVIDLPCEGAPARRRREGAPVRLASAPVRPDNDVRRGPEATLSLVSLGGLLLHNGSPAAALAQFDRYLGVAGPRPLAVEALYGRGRALRALGRAGDEAQTWRRLLREHPGSPYAEHARRRLAELGG